MSVDYDAPRISEAGDGAEDSLESLERLTRRHTHSQPTVIDVDDTDSGESVELPGADLSGEEFSMLVIPQQADEFTCSSCFLVHHRSQLAIGRGNQMICAECA
jgi:hypothetical protein